MSLKPIILAQTGASGAIYAIRLLEELTARGREVEWLLSAAGEQVARTELELELGMERWRDALGERLGEERLARIKRYDTKDFYTPPASGSAGREIMVVCPCSMGTLGRLANGVGGGLIERAAEVILKERRRLIVVPRETPISSIQLRNMLTLSETGAVILPAMPGFYSGAPTFDALVDFVVARILAQIGEEQELLKPWASEDT